MSNPFQDQFLKAGVVTKKQVQKANSEQKKNKKPRSKKDKVIDENKLHAQKLAQEKAELDRELNKKREEQAKNKAISAEINQLITQNKLKRNEGCDIVYNFEHQKKIKRIYINHEMKQQIIDGKLGIARIEGCYELVPRAIAEKIQQRNEKRVILIEYEDKSIDADDPYADYQVPDDLIW